MSRRHDDVHLSKSLSRILRHDADKLGLHMSPDGYVSVSELLTSPRSWLSKDAAYTERDILAVVERNDKQRFAVRRDSRGQLEIRANQGHSLRVENLELRPITDASEFPDVIHGTSLKNWQTIKDEGLKPMRRTHVHFAPGIVGEEGVISGMRKNCEILIYIDLKKAMDEGLEFYLSSNRVVLCNGDADSVIRPRYFLKVVDRKNRCELEL